MKIRLDKFKGRIPKIADRALPDQAATVAKNCNLLSGNIQPFGGTGTIVPFVRKTPPLSTIYNQVPGDVSSYWLTWTKAETQNGTFVDVARGPILDDNNDTIIFTNAADYSGFAPINSWKPKITNLSLAFTSAVQSSNPPFDWRYLGVPSPATTLTAVSTINSSAVPQNVIVDGSTLTGVLQSIVGSGGTITLDGAVGNPAGSVKLVANDAKAAVTTIYSPTGGFGGYINTSCDFYFDNNSTTQVIFTVGSDNTGSNGLTIFAQRDIAHSSTDIGITQSSSGWEGSGFFLTSGLTSANLVNTHWYTMNIVGTPLNSDLSLYNLVINILDSGSPLFTYTIPNYTPNTGAGANFSVSTVSYASTATIHVDNMIDQSLTLVGNPSYEVTSYAQTWYTDLGYEGPEGGTSGVVWIGPALHTVVTGFDNSPPSGYGVIGSRLYRAVTGASTTAFQFNTQFSNLTTTTYTDTLLDSQLGEVLSTDTYDLPPNGAPYVCTMSNGITVIGTGNTLYPSVQYVPYAYPVANKLAVDYPIQRILDIESQAVVLTSGSSYLLTGADPSAMTLTKLTPTYGCVSSASATKWNLTGAVYTAGVIYASNDGLVLVNGFGATLVTKDFITPTQWQTMYNPSTIIGAIYQDMYYGVYYNTGTSSLAAFLFDPREQGLGFVDLTIPATAVFKDPVKDAYYYADATGVIYGWNIAPGSPLSYQWKSKQYELPYRGTFQCAQVRGVPATGFPSTTLDVYLDSSGSAAYTKTVTTNKEFVLPPNQSYDIQLQLSGTAEIATVELAELMEELT